MLKKFTTDGGNTMRIKDFVKALSEGEYVYPAAQRSYSYKAYNEQNLIISILMGIPIDTISLIRMPDDRYLIADGMHRSTAICRFAEGKFSLPEKPRQDLFMRDCVMNDDECDNIVNLEDYGCEDLYGKSYEDVKRTFNDYRINLCVFKPARPEDIDDIVVSVMKIKNKSTKTMPESRLKLVPILYANPSYEKFWKTIDAEMTEGAVAGSDKNSQTNLAWYTEFFLNCFKKLNLSDKDLSCFADNIILSGNTGDLKYSLWKDLFALHGHMLSVDDIRNIVSKKDDSRHDNTWISVFNSLVNKTQDKIWTPIKTVSRKRSG